MGIAPSHVSIVHSLLSSWTFIASIALSMPLTPLHWLT